MSNTELVRLSEEEAADFAVLDTRVKEGHRTFIEVGFALLEIRDRRLYLQEFGTFEEYCRSRCGHGRNYGDRLINAATVAKEIALANPDDSYARNQIPDTVAVAYPLHELPKSERVEAWNAVNERTNGKPTFPDVREEVDRRKGKSPKRKGKPKDKSKGQSNVNGKLVDDPPSVARARRKGTLAPDVIPEVTIPAETTSTDEIREEHEEALAKSVDALGDEDWLNGLPLYDKLTGLQKRCFKEDALAYREADKARQSYQAKLRTIPKPRKLGPWRFAQNRAVTLADPSRWIVCPPTDQGGCGGQGTLKLIGDCPRCRTHGFIIPS